MQSALFAVLAFIVFVIVAILAWTSTTISSEHLFSLLAVGLAFVALHLAFGGPSTVRHL